MNMKAAASLTGSLLARKGAAYPAAYSAPSSAPSAAPTENDGDSQQPQRAYNDPRVIASAPPQPAAAPEAPAAPPAPGAPPQQGEAGSDPTDGAEPGSATPAAIPSAAGDEGLSIPQAMDKMGRVRLSVRLDPDRYLRVKMASARTRWSAQDIVIAALDRYLGGSSGKAAKTESDAEDGGDDEDSVT